MSREEIARLVTSTISAVLKRPLDATGAISRTTTEGWDSLKQVEIMLTIEEALGVEFTEQEFSELDSLAALVDAACRHHAT